MSISVEAVEPSPGVSGLPTRMGGVRTRLGIMGGTFDPIHYGHLVTAEEALHQFELDEVLFVPTGRPWMKEHEVVSPPEDRYLMTVIATASNPLFRVSRVEVDRDGPTYAVDTLRELQHERGDDTDLFFVTGADAVLEIFEQWKQTRRAVRPGTLHRGDPPRVRPRGVRGACADEASRYHRDERPCPRDLARPTCERACARAVRSATWCPRV